MDIILKKEIKVIDNGFKCNGICVLQNRNLFIIGGISNKIKLYNSENYECIGNFKSPNNEDILGLTLLNKNLVLSYSNIIVLWTINN